MTEPLGVMKHEHPVIAYIDEQLLGFDLQFLKDARKRGSRLDFKVAASVYEKPDGRLAIDTYDAEYGDREGLHFVEDSADNVPCKILSASIPFPSMIEEGSEARLDEVVTFAVVGYRSSENGDWKLLSYVAEWGDGDGFGHAYETAKRLEPHLRKNEQVEAWMVTVPFPFAVAEIHEPMQTAAAA